jgi:hypothetical protein
MTGIKVLNTAEIYSTPALHSQLGVMDTLGVDQTNGSGYFTLANVQLPAWSCQFTDWYSITRNSLPKKTDKDYHDDLVGGFYSWYRTCGLICQRLCAPNADLKNVSGLNTSGLAIDGIFQYEGNMAPGYSLLVTCESTAELRVKPGREVELLV